jgi:hypothetical protein
VSTQKFEDRLLGELKQIVLERAAKRPGPVAHRPAWRSRPVLVGAVAALAAGVVVGPPLLRADEASAAWAVTESDDGWITVTITEFKDADGLEHTLEQLGVAAEVDFLPPGTRCREPRFELAPGRKELHLKTTLGEHPTETLQFRRTTVKAGETLVIAGSAPRVSKVDPPEPLSIDPPQPGGENLTVTYTVDGASMEVAQGIVAPCDVVPAEES